MPKESNFQETQRWTVKKCTHTGKSRWIQAVLAVLAEGLVGTIHSRSAHIQAVLAEGLVLTHFGDITKPKVDEYNGLCIIMGDKVIATLYTEADIVALDSDTLRIILKRIRFLHGNLNITGKPRETIVTS